ncbi:MAG TPA: nucleotidyltransferase family protein [Actinomadura sp.]|nr:nucleotidyltransferase family protein [Actinomadura sp.]
MPAQAALGGGQLRQGQGRLVLRQIPAQGELDPRTARKVVAPRSEGCSPAGGRPFAVPSTSSTLTCAEAAVDAFPTTTCCLGVRCRTGQRWRVYAPHGLTDVFNLVVRPNPVLAPRSVYEAKTTRWRRQWPELTVLPWSDSAT